MTDERKEKDGRPARGRRARAACQRVPKPGGGFHYRKQPIDPTTGRRVSIFGDSEEECLARCAHLRAARRDLSAGIVSIEQAAERARRARERAEGYPVEAAWLAHARSVAVGAAYRGKLEGLWRRHGAGSSWARIMCHELSPEVVQGWLDSRPVSPRSRRNLWHVLRAAMRRALAAGKVGAIPWGAAWVPAFPPTASPERAALASKEDEIRFLGAARALSAERAARYGLRDDLHHRAAIMIHLALRRGEAAALSWHHVSPLDDGDLLVTIEHQGRESWRKRALDGEGPTDPTKTREPRRVRVSRDGLVGRALRACLVLATEAGQAEPWRPVMPDRSGRHCARDVIAPKLMREIASRAGLHRPGRHWVQHSTRHSGVTRELAEGVPLKDVQALTGHKSLTSLMVYAHRVGVGVPTSRADLVLPSMAEPERSPVEVAALLELESEHERARRRVADAHARYLGRDVHSLAQHLPPAGAALPGRGWQPKAVRAEARAAYVRGYNAARRRGEAAQACVSAGKKASRAMLGAWGRLLEAERRIRADPGAPRLGSGREELEQGADFADDREDHEEPRANLRDMGAGARAR